MALLKDSSRQEGPCLKTPPGKRQSIVRKSSVEIVSAPDIINLTGKRCMISGDLVDLDKEMIDKIEV